MLTSRPLNVLMNAANAPAHVTPGSPIDVPSRPLPCIPTPTMPNRTVSLAAT